MTPFISDVLLAVSGSLAASILVKVTITTTLALVAVRFARRSRAAVRHTLLAAAFAVLLLLPIAAVVAPSVRVACRFANRLSPTCPRRRRSMKSPRRLPSREQAVLFPPRRSSPFTLSMSTVLLVTWAVGTTLCLVPIVIGLWQVRGLRRSGLPWRQGRAVVEALAVRARVLRPVEVLVHESIAGPMTCGVVHPAIVLPADAETWTAVDLHRAVVHELEHVRRGDWISQCLARVICAGYWFHPLVWISRRELQLEAERACDDAVLAGVEATAYADQLVALAKRLSATAKSPLLAMANRRDLAARVDAVLDKHQARGRAGAVAIVLSAVVAAVVIATISPLRMVAEAQSGIGTNSRTVGESETRIDVRKFDVVSIKPCASGSLPATGRGAGPASGSFRASSGNLYAECQTPADLIRFAYLRYGDGKPWPISAFGFRDPPISHRLLTQGLQGSPAWVNSDRYTIETAGETGEPTEMVLGPMLQTVLEERFKLRMHRETRDVPIYELTVAGRGPKLQPTREGSCIPFRDRSDLGPPLPGQPKLCGLFYRSETDSGIDTYGQTMAALAEQLSGWLDWDVVDKTGIGGMFDVHLDIPSDDPSWARCQVGARRRLCCNVLD